MPKLINNLPQSLRAFEFHGVDLQVTGKQAISDCPLCGAENKFNVQVETGLWHCYRCDAGGNSRGFLQSLWEASDQNTDDYKPLADDRGLLPDTIMRWGAVRSVIDGGWLLPGYNVEGHLCQLYRYVSNGKRKLLMPTPEHGHQLFGLPPFNTKYDTVYLCEGPWDAMRLWEVLRTTKLVDGSLSGTANYQFSLAHKSLVLAVPGCNVFFDVWMPLLAGRNVLLLYDNDHPKQHPKTDKTLPPAGYNAMQKVASKIGDKCNVSLLQWGDNGYDLKLPDGYDLRDALNGGIGLAGIFERLKPFDGKQSIKSKSSNKGDMACLECDNYRKLINSWRKAMKWTDGLDHALTVMLASVASTKSLGDQLWIKVIGPAACLDGKTPIYDPIAKTNLTVAERQQLGTKFWVYTRKKNGVVGVAQALPPQRFDPEPMYEVSFASGRTMRVTGGHRFWGGDDYVALHTIADELRLSDAYPIPTISGIDLLAQRQGVLPKTGSIVKVEYVGHRAYYDFHVPETQNYWACGVFNHNCGKTTLAEALAVNKRWVTAKSTIRGFHSGFREDGKKGEDNSLLTELYNKTLITKDGDTLLQSPNLSQILSEARDIYDGVSRTHYRNKMSKDYEGLRMTWILCGTSSLRSIDSSELGERFLDCVLMDEIDDELEDAVLMRVINRTMVNLTVESDGDARSHFSPELAEAMRLTGGYVEWLRINAIDRMSNIEVPVEAKRICTRLGKFTAHMRARPSKLQDEKAEREFASRLVIQLGRLAGCLAVVLNRRSIDDAVMQRVRRVALDTSRGTTLQIVSHLQNSKDEGLEAHTIALYINTTDDMARKLLRFLRSIHVVEQFVPKVKGVKSRPRWRLTNRMTKLYNEVMNSDA